MGSPHGAGLDTAAATSGAAAPLPAAAIITRHRSARALLDRGPRCLAVRSAADARDQSKNVEDAGGDVSELSKLTSPQAVEAAMEEFRHLGREAFLARHGFGKARRFFVQGNDGMLY